MTASVQAQPLVVDTDALLRVPRFPSPELVDAAASMFGRPLYTAVAVHGGAGQRGREFYLGVSAGTVSLRMQDHDRTERTLSIARKNLGTEAARLVLGYDRDTPWADLEHLVVIDVDDDGAPVRPTGRSGRVITEWTRKSRSRMTRTMAELDYAPIFDTGRTTAMGTLTYPGQWDRVAPSGTVVKGHFRDLRKRWARAWGTAPALVWKLEFQRRGAPHFHFFFAPEHGETLCSCCGQSLAFRFWLSHQWADVVAADDTVTDAYGNTERSRHRLAGTGIDFRAGGRMTDPKRLAVYFTKHSGAGGGKEYQHRVPVQWQTPTTGPGRFWGYCGLERVAREVVLHDVAEFVQLRRTLRRWSASRKMTREFSVPRGQAVDVSTGEVTVKRRKVTRRVGYLARGGLSGGFVCVNDGPAFAATLSRLLG